MHLLDKMLRLLLVRDGDTQLLEYLLLVLEFLAEDGDVIGPMRPLLEVLLPHLVLGGSIHLAPDVVEVIEVGGDFYLLVPQDVVLELDIIRLIECIPNILGKAVHCSLHCVPVQDLLIVDGGLLLLLVVRCCIGDRRIH